MMIEHLIFILMLNTPLCFGDDQTDKPNVTVSSGLTIIPAGGNVTLTCSLKSTSGWKYKWFRQIRGKDEVQVNTSTEESKNITVSQGGIYRCVGVRGKPEVYTPRSDEVIIEITFSNKAVVNLQPNWPQIFSGETITLTCEVQEGETTEWTCEWRMPGSASYPAKQLTLNVSESHSDEYECRCRSVNDWYSSTEWSEAIKLTALGKPKARLRAESTYLQVGSRVTLTCSLNQSYPLSSGGL
ncbi:PREDICTED: B-cell receptor CD22-like [Cyprinodon variegatus]|uniref:B-cell receptor CD22-like n=1 Tax=Cyprinodon variegatus TaxID=28743 RepID=UPI0007427F9F|nr:PREDICTED: B-cell receptor CD22-like [Cyprinodon variegatus]